MWKIKIKKRRKNNKKSGENEKNNCEQMKTGKVFTVLSRNERKFSEKRA